MKAINILDTLVSAEQKDLMIRNMTITIAHNELLKRFPKIKMYKGIAGEKFLAMPVPFLFSDIDDYRAMSEYEVAQVVEEAFDASLGITVSVGKEEAYYISPNKSHVITGLDDCAIILYHKMFYVISGKKFLEAKDDNDTLMHYANYYEDVVLGMYD